MCMPEATATAEVAPVRLPDGRDAYIFNPKKFDWVTEQIVNDRSFVDPRNEQDIEAIKVERAKLREWAEKFSGKIPIGWGEVHTNPWYIEYDIEHPDIKLTDIQMDAAIEYPDESIAVSLGLARKLKPEQLEKWATRWGVGWQGWKDVAKAQKEKFGANNEIIDATEEKVPPELVGVELEIRDRLVASYKGAAEKAGGLSDEALQEFNDDIKNFITNFILASRKPQKNKT